VQRIRLGGGGARSAVWSAIQADVYGQTVELLEAEEGGAFGAALLAGTGAGAWASVAEACSSTIRVKETVEPRHAKTMADGYEQYRRIYPALREIGSR
jgi:xylulokinase